MLLLLLPMKLESRPSLRVLICTYLQLSSYKKRKRTDKHAYEEWKSTVIVSYNPSKAKGSEGLSVYIYIPCTFTQNSTRVM